MVIILLTVVLIILQEYTQLELADFQVPHLFYFLMIDFELS
jgi:hypothetical protein